MAQKNYYKIIQKLPIIPHLSMHFIVSAVFGWFVFLKTKSTGLFFVSLLTGTLIDIDHFIDYFLYFGPKFKLKKFIDGDCLYSGRLFVLFHSWELLIPLWALSILLGLVDFAFAFTLGFASHLLTDNFFVTKKIPFVYFLSLRLTKKFNLDKIFEFHRIRPD